MSELKGVFDSLYTGLLLRDLGGKVAPGLVLMAAGNALGSPDPIDATVKRLDGLDVGAWVAVIGLAWLTGFAIQGVGELIGSVGDKWKRLGFLPIRYFPADETTETFYTRLAAFDKVASDKDQQRFERFVVVKEATGNACIAAALGTALLATDDKIQGLGWITPGMVILGLGRMHCATVKRNLTYATAVIQRSPTTAKPE